MEKTRVLFVSQEIYPFVKENELSKISRILPEKVSNDGKDVRVFMPRYGCINERRYNLHEVIRLSGINVIIDNNDHLLIIKVARMPNTNIQVYFIDNQEFFQRKFIFRDDKKNFFQDNSTRAIFFARSVAESIKKLGWSPNVIVLHGWMSALLAPMVKYVFSKHPLFSESKVVLALHNDQFEEKLSDDTVDKLIFDDLTSDLFPNLLKDTNYINLMKDSLMHSDAAIIMNENINSDILQITKTLSIPVVDMSNEEDLLNNFNDFIDDLVAEELFS
ncbi:MAG TPA: glycogen/starch synthase [Bacteroidales bacterium]|nr:glycogen/starch synthase [Bacteroidales bacterium]